MECVNCPGATDHSTAECPMVRAPRELLERVANNTDCGYFISSEQRQLRALLTAQPQAKCVTCGEPTKFGKPYCEDHCYELPPVSTAPQVGAGCFVQPVPDHCDRITWRGHYYQLPNGLTQASAAQSAPVRIRMPVRLHDVVEETDFPPNYANGYNTALDHVLALNAAQSAHHCNNCLGVQPESCMFAQSAPTGAMTWDMQREAQQCMWVMREIACMDADDVTGDNVDLRFEDAKGADTGCDVSIVEYAERTAKVLESMLLAQSAPAGEREAFEAVVRLNWASAPLHYVRDALPKDDPRYGQYVDETLQGMWVGWQGRAAWQRTQSAGVPEGWQLVPTELAEPMLDAAHKLYGTNEWGNASDDEIARLFWRTLLAAAPAQPAAQGEFGDAYQGAREDLAIWKRRALEAEDSVRELEARIDTLILDCQGESRMGEPVIPTAQGQGEVQRLREALNHIIRTCQGSRTSTRRLRWIEQRAQFALDGKPYSDDAFDLPKDAAGSNEKLRAKVKDLRSLLNRVRLNVSQLQGMPGLLGDIEAELAASTGQEVKP